MATARVIRAAILAAVVCGAVAPLAAAQGARQGENAGFSFEVFYSRSASRFSTETSGVEQDQRQAEGFGRGARMEAHFTPVTFSARAESRESQEKTPFIAAEETGFINEATLAAQFDFLRLSASTQALEIERSLADRVSGADFFFRVHQTLDYLAGVGLSLGIFDASYAQGPGRLEVRSKTAGALFADERYTSRAEAFSYGLRLGEGKGLFLTAFADRSEFFPRKGTTFDLHESFNESLTWSVGWVFDGKDYRTIRLVSTAAQEKVNLTGLLVRDATTDTASLRIEPGGGLILSLSQSLRRTRESYSPLLPFQNYRNKMDESAVSVGWRF